MVGLDGRENVRSTLGFLDSDGPLGDAALVSEKLLVLKMSGSKLRLPLLLRRAEDVRLLGDSAVRGSAELKLGM